MRHTRRNFLGASAGLVGGAILAGRPGIISAQNSRTLQRMYEMLLPTSGVNLRDHGAVGDSVADDTAAIRRAYAAVPDGGTLLIPAGKYRVTSQIVFNRRVNVVGEGIASVFWIMFARGDQAAIQFGTPYSDAGVVTSTIGNFSVQGTSNNIARHAIAFYRLFDCNVGPIYVMPGTQSHAVLIGGCLQSYFDIVQEQNFPAFEPDRVVFPRSGPPAHATAGTRRTLSQTAAKWLPDGYVAKGVVLTGGAGFDASRPSNNFYRVVNNSAGTVTVDRDFPRPPDPTTLFRIVDSLAYPQRGCTVCVVNIEELPGYKASVHGPGMPTNASVIRIRQSGGGSRSTGGLLVRPQPQLGGNNLYTGKIEGNSNADKTLAETGGGYGFIILGGVNWKIRDMHVEGNENGNLIADTSDFAIQNSLFSPLGNTPASSEKLQIGPRARNFSVEGCTIGHLRIDPTCGGYAIGHCQRNNLGPGSFQMSSPPRTGTWRSGDRVFYDPLPANPRFVGAVCIEGGTPGRWREFGSIS